MMDLTKGQRVQVQTGGERVTARLESESLFRP